MPEISGTRDTACECLRYSDKLTFDRENNAAVRYADAVQEFAKAPTEGEKKER
jgi:hypothetical protein